MSDKRIPKLLSILLPVTALFLIIFREYILALVPYFPGCYFYQSLHLYCPSCGSTRSVVSLLHGDVMGSLRFNVVPAIMLLFLFLAYVELVTYSFGRRVPLLPRKLRFYLILIAGLVLYWIIRNFIPFLTP